MIDKNYSQLILRGIEEGDQIGGPYELAKILLGSLKQKNGFIIYHPKQFVQQFKKPSERSSSHVPSISC